MMTLQVTEEPGGWSLRVGHGIAALYPTRLHAVEQARWLAGQFAQQGEPAEVQVEPVQAIDRAH